MRTTHRVIIEIDTDDESSVTEFAKYIWGTYTSPSNKGVQAETVEGVILATFGECS